MMKQSVSYFFIAMVLLSSNLNAERHIFAKIRNHIPAHGVTVTGACSRRVRSKILFKMDLVPTEISMRLTVADGELFSPTFVLLAVRAWNSPFINVEVSAAEQSLGEWAGLVVNIMPSGQDDAPIIDIVPILA
jgi:hypothetical protein